MEWPGCVTVVVGPPAAPPAPAPPRVLAGAVVVTETMAVAVAAAPVLAEGAAAPGVWPGERNVVPVPFPALVEPVAAEEEPDAVLEPLALPLADVWADVPVALVLAEVPVRALVAWQLLRVGGTVSKGGWVQRTESGLVGWKPPVSGLTGQWRCCRQEYGSSRQTTGQGPRRRSQKRRGSEWSSFFGNVYCFLCRELERSVVHRKQENKVVNERL